MRTGLLLSLLLHLAMLAVALVGVPSLLTPAPPADEVIQVQVVRVAEETKAPPPAAEPDPQPQPEPEPPPPPPAPPRQPAPPPPPEPVSRPEPAPEPEPSPPPPSPEPAPAPPEKAVAVPRPKPAPPEPKPAPKPAAPEPAKPAPTPEKKKQPEPRRDNFDSLLKTVEEFKEAPPRPPEDFERQVREAVNLREERLRARSSAEALTLSEIDAIRAQIQRNWNVPAGARDAEDLVVDVYVELNPDGSVMDARIIDTSRYASDSFFRTAADSARRAVLLTNRVQGLPEEKYSRWRSIILSFNPKDMIY